MSKCPFAAIIQATAPAVAPKVPQIVDDFYDRMFKENPEAKQFFNPANQFKDPPLQRQALANAIVAYAGNIENLGALTGAVEIIAHKHCALNILPEHYPIVHKNLMASIGQVLGDVVTPEIGDGWSQAVLFLAKVLWEKEEELYKMAEARRGGWRGKKNFKVSHIRQVSARCKEFTFEAVEGNGPIDFTPGQFLTVHLGIDGATPRHYTVTSAPGQSHLKCCIKEVDKGFVSSAMHSLQIGTVVGLSPPFGAFGLHDKPAVLISAGIGITPMKCFLESAPDQILFALHVDRDAAEHPWKADFDGVNDEKNEAKTECWYTCEKGRPAPEQLVEGILKPYIKDCDFYLCASPDMQLALQKALKEAGAEGVYLDSFTPELAHLSEAAAVRASAPREGRRRRRSCCC